MPVTRPTANYFIHQPQVTMDASFWVFTSLLIAVAAQRLPPPGVPVQPLPQAIGNDFGFRYSVNDFNGNEHSHQQEKTGHVVRGQYKVLLPDGRLQTVTYVADENGYRAEVDYTPARPGEATTAGFGGPPFEPVQPPIVRPPLLPPVRPPVFFGRTSVEIDPQAEQLAAFVAAPSTDTSFKRSSSTDSSTTLPATSSTTLPITPSTTTTARSTANPSDSQRGARQFTYNSHDRVIRPADPPTQVQLQYPTYYGADSQLKFSAYPYAYTQHY